MQCPLRGIKYRSFLFGENENFNIIMAMGMNLKKNIDIIDKLFIDI